MKIKIKQLKVISKHEKVELNDIEGEISFNEIKEMIQSKIIGDIMNGSHSIPPCPPVIKPFMMYKGNVKFIEIGDIIEMLPSENCVTNADTIKYDEKIDGLVGEIVGINYTSNIISVQLKKYGPVLVHPTWLKLINKKETK